MDRSRARRTTAIAAASAALHVLLLVALVIGIPWSGPARAPDQPAIQITLERPPPPPIEPRPMTAKPQSNPPAMRTAPPPPAVAPPQAVTSAAPEPGADAQAAMGDLVRALRGSVGCSNPDAVGLTPAERDACRHRLHAGLEDAKPLSGVSADKQAELDHVAHCNDAYRAYRAHFNGPDMPAFRDCGLEQ